MNFNFRSSISIEYLTKISFTEFEECKNHNVFRISQKINDIQLKYTGLPTSHFRQAKARTLLITAQGQSRPSGVILSRDNQLSKVLKVLTNSDKTWIHVRYLRSLHYSSTVSQVPFRITLRRNKTAMQSYVGKKQINNINNIFI